MQTEREKLAARLTEMKANGLVDFKVTLGPGASSIEQVCGEINRMMDSRKRATLDFGDDRRSAGFGGPCTVV